MSEGSIHGSSKFVLGNQVTEYIPEEFGKGHPEAGLQNM